MKPAASLLGWQKERLRTSAHRNCCWAAERRAWSLVGAVGVQGQGSLEHRQTGTCTGPSRAQKTTWNIAPSPEFIKMHSTEGELPQPRCSSRNILHPFVTPVGCLGSPWSSLLPSSPRNFGQINTNTCTAMGGLIFETLIPRRGRTAGIPAQSVCGACPEGMMQTTRGGQQK